MVPLTFCGGHPRRWFIAAVLAALPFIVPAGAAAQTARDVSQLSLQELLSTRVRSVSLKAEEVFRTAAAVYVITREDIRASGAQSIPDLLRMVPGVTVAQIDANRWAVTSRGFNGPFANKLLVIVDGRNVYSEMFGGVHWDMINIPLRDIERIEVTRGPGGTLWGANAVNGVINIVTRSASETQRAVVRADMGAPGQAFSDVRFGGRAAEDKHYRVYAKYGSRESNPFETGDGASGWMNVRLAGVRFDSRGDVDAVTLQGALQNATGSRHGFAEGNAALAWRHATSDRVASSVKASYQAYRRTEGVFAERWQLAGVEARHRRAIGRRHDLSAGLGYQLGAVAVENTPTFSVTPPDERLQTFLAFVHDDIQLADRLWLSTGAKFQRHAFSNGEVQPTLRVMWLPTPAQAVWGAASRAVRVPTKLDRGMHLSMTAPTSDGRVVEGTIDGDPTFRSETLHAFETGYRARSRRASMDVTFFRNEYHDLRGLVVGGPSTRLRGETVVTEVPLTISNVLDASALGAEVMASARPFGWWHINASHSWIAFENHLRARTSTDVAVGGAVPEHQSHLRTTVDLPRDIHVSAQLFHVSALTTHNASPYTKLDLHLEWDLGQAVELSGGVRDLWHNGHAEYVFPGAHPVRRTLFGGLQWSF